MIPQSIQYYFQANWRVFFDLLSQVERRVVYTIATEAPITGAEIADKCLVAIECVEPILERLQKHNAIYSVDGNGVFTPVWELTNREFAQYCQQLPIEEIFNPEAIVTQLTDEFYRLATKRYSRMQELGTHLSLASVHQAIGKKIRQQECQNRVEWKK